MVSTLVQKSTVRKRIGLKVKKKLTKSLLSPSSIVLYVSNICYVVPCQRSNYALRYADVAFSLKPFKGRLDESNYYSLHKKKQTQRKYRNLSGGCEIRENNMSVNSIH